MTLDYYNKMKCYQKKKSITMHVLSSRKVSFQLPRRVSSTYMEQKHLIRIIKEVSLLSLQLPLWYTLQTEPLVKQV